MSLSYSVTVLAATWIAATTLSAQDRMASVDVYLIADRDAEIALARSAAPTAISHDATIMVLGRRGYEIAVKGSNGFVCLVERGWFGPFDMPWNAKVRGPDCLNPEASRSVLPIAEKETAMYLARQSRTEVIAAIKQSIAKGELPKLEPGAMGYMMSRSAYLTDDGDHNGSHLMFFTPVAHPTDWGAGVEHSPVVASISYWFKSPNPESTNFPPLVIFAVPVSTWSDGTPAAH